MPSREYVSRTYPSNKAKDRTVSLSLFAPMTTMGDGIGRKFDIVVFGATGFTGQYVVEELARTADEEKELKWAVAGRSMQKLQQILSEASAQTGKDLSDVPVIIADVTSEKSLTEMCAQAKVILNCVGPYRFYGTPVVKACIEQQCHHVDISGEPEWLEKVQLLFHGKAEEAGIYILQCCGFDSIPNEMGVQFMKEQFDGDLNSIENYMSLNRGPEGEHFNYGTWMSAIYSIANRKELKNIRSQLYPTSLPKSKHRPTKRYPVFYHEKLGKWCVRFAGSDHSVAYRTSRFNYEQRKQRVVQCAPFLCLDSIWQLLLMMFVGMIIMVFTRFQYGISLLAKYPRIMSFGLFDSTGPSRKQVQDASFKMTFFGRGFETKLPDLDKDHEDLPSKKIVASLTGPDPGYVTCSICAVQAAYVLLKEKDKLPPNGGVYTPGAAFADSTLLSRLQKHNLKFSVIEK